MLAASLISVVSLALVTVYTSLYTPRRKYTTTERLREAGVI